MAETNGHKLATTDHQSRQPELPMSSPAPAAMGSADLTPADFLHAWRRRWLLCLPIGLGLALVVAGVVWLLQEPAYEAEAYLKISSTGTELVFDQRHTADNFEILQGTQRELAKTRFVMTAALREPEVARLEVVRKQARPVEWLMEKISIVTPKDTEIMRVSLATEDPESSVELVNGVVRAYEKEVINFEQLNRQLRLNEVSRVYTEKEADLRRKRSELKEIAQRLGSGVDSAALSVKNQILLQQLGGLRRQLVGVQSELWRAESELMAAQEMQKALEGSDPEDRPVNDRELELALVSDTIYRQLLADKVNAMRMQRESRSAFKDRVPDLAAKIHEAVDVELQARRETLGEEIRDMAPLRTRASITELGSQVQVLKRLEAQFQQEINALNLEIERVGNQSIDVEMRRDEIEQLEAVMASIAQEREQLRVELRSRPRVEVHRPAKLENTVLANRMTRPALAGLSGIMAFFVPVAFILFNDVRTKLVNSSADFTYLSDLEVLGTVPLIPSQAIRLQGTTPSGKKRFEYWQTVLSESVNRVASGLLADSRGRGPRMILVTSAVAGEGKTTLATQLAMSLARAGRTVTLVDLDLRRPMIHQTFGVSNENGISEVLRGETDLEKTVQPTAMENLSIVSAGRCDAAAVRMLAHESTASLFKEIRGLGEFVIIDGCPVLPLADTGFICPHVDTVMFAVRRDVSQVDQVRAAQGFITKCGNTVAGAVVAEGGATRYRDDRYYRQEQEVSS